MNFGQRDIVEEAYGLFKGYKVGKPLDVCRACCVNDAEEHQLVTLNIRNIPCELLYTWNHAAKSQRPAISEFKHFLPRILELISQFEFPSHSVELSLKSFHYYDRAEWKMSEQSLVERFAASFFDTCLGMYPLENVRSLDEVLIMFDIATVDISKFLHKWSASSSKEAALHFGDFVFESIENGKLAKTYKGFAGETFKKTLNDWVSSPGVALNFFDRLQQLISSDDEIDEYARWNYLRACEQLHPIL